MATEAVILRGERKEPEVRLHQSHHRAKGPAIACGRCISHRGHPSIFPLPGNGRARYRNIWGAKKTLSIFNSRKDAEVTLTLDVAKEE
jgi:hypothetical protein